MPIDGNGVLSLAYENRHFLVSCNYASIISFRVLYFKRHEILHVYIFLFCAYKPTNKNKLSSCDSSNIFRTFNFHHDFEKRFYSAHCVLLNNKLFQSHCLLITINVIWQKIFSAHNEFY